MIYQPDKPLAIIAGEGELPQLILLARQEHHADNFIIAIKGKTPETVVEGVAHQWFRFGAVGEMLEVLAKRGITQLVLAGRISRPSLVNLFPDSKGRELLKMLGSGLFSGDNRLLSKVVQFLEQHNITVVGAHEICGTMLADFGVMTQTKPTQQHDADAKLGAKLLHDIAPYDVGQAVVIEAGAVVAIEGMEGTAELLRRSASFTQGEAVLVKTPKSNQELRADMPAIGVDTIHSLQAHGFAGAYLETGKTLMLNKNAIISAADAANLFIVGLEDKIIYT
jgi:UDP-2,3-diacylglucosamine hydrolase